MARTPKTDTVETADFVHKDAKRVNNPPARIASEGRVPRVPRATYRYNPHLPPVLRFDPTGKFTADPVVLHIHERLSTRAIIAAGARYLKVSRPIDFALMASQPSAQFAPMEWRINAERHQPNWDPSWDGSREKSIGPDRM